MTKLIMLGTGHGGVLDSYNTCFALKNDNGIFLIDSGGSIEIRKRLKESHIELKDVKNIFISHSHTDHLLGLIWLFKKIGVMSMHKKIIEKIDIYCNDVVYEAIKGVSIYVLPAKLLDIIFEITNFIIIKDGDKYKINGVDYEFFDIHARGTKQFGFECCLEGKRFIFLGDEPLNKDLYSRVEHADYVTHEAFCLDSEADIFEPYKKNHSTALSTARVMSNLNIKNLILYHTEDSHGRDRKRLYTEEAKRVFTGNVLVPNDLEEIDL